MASLVGFVGLSHSPFWIPGQSVDGPGSRFIRGVEQASARVASWAADVVLVVGPDHFRNFFYDVMPPFCMGIGDVRGFGDYDTISGDLPSAPELARAIHAGVTAAGFDPAASLAMGVDHGISQPYQALWPDADVALLPVMISTSGPARPSLQRCIDFGVALGRAVEAAPVDARVVICASGGLSHWVRPVCPDDSRTDAEIRDYVVHGRERAVEYSAMRDRGVAERRASGHESPVNAAWDEATIDALVRGDFGAIAAQGDEHIEKVAGNGALEIRAWLAAAAAWNRPVECLAYEPVAKWATGMACFASEDLGDA